ncbi:FAD-dependent oxidoreductase [Longimycelium tulufanense]|nr:FAD-dependent oxidoreductase [Longimycelium tulufanense]
MAERTGVCVVGGGPAGMVAGLLLARAGVEVTVLEKHADFLRDFRGDTVHASTLTLLDELGLGAEFARVPHRLIEAAQVQLDSGTAQLGDFRRLPGPHRHIALVPQWDFLDLLADAGRRERTFSLRMNTEVTGLLSERGRVSGVRYRTADGTSGVLRAELVLACDGRNSVVAVATGLRPREFGVPMDVWWFCLPRHENDAAGAVGRFGGGGGMALIDRGDYFQCAFLIRKGTDARLRAEGIEAFRDRVASFVPWLADRTDAVRSWDDVKLLNVRLNRLRRWFDDGVLCLGDAAHAMSPVGGVGINLAIQDAVAAARILAEPLRNHRVRRRDLARVQVRRWAPTTVTQGLQRLAHAALLGPAISGQLPRIGSGDREPRLVRLARRFPRLQVIPAYLVGIGLLPEHAPAWARREDIRLDR